MRRLLSAVSFTLAASLVVAACTKVPFSGRRQLNLLPAATMNALGKQSYDATLSEARVVRGTPDAELLGEVGRRIQRVAKEPDFEWSTALIGDEAINAWCLPGGYIGFYEGILPVLENEAGMGFVMGHEVGHAIAHHGAERMSQQLAAVGGLTVLDAYLSGQEIGEANRGMILAALGLGIEVGVLLPFSRKHESEADVIGTMYMASAGYPPDEALAVWDRMGAATGGAGVPAFLSTHPPDDKRQSVIREWLPKARKRYSRNRTPDDKQQKLW